MSWLGHIVISIGALVMSIFGNNHIINVNTATTSLEETQSVTSTSMIGNTIIATTSSITTGNGVVTKSPANTDIKIFATTTGMHASAHVQLSGDEITTVTCGSSGCFAKEFAICSPAIEDISFGPTIFHAEILGTLSDRCRVSMEYTKYPNSAWVNQPMICMLDSKNSFAQEQQNAFSTIQSPTSTCKGPLAAIVRAWMNGSGDHR